MCDACTETVRSSANARQSAGAPKYSNAPAPLCRDDEAVPGPLTLASAACPALRELEVESWHLDQPPAPLPHLTRLHATDIDVPPDGAVPLRRLAAAAPRLEVLDWFSGFDPAIAKAAEGHPCLHAEAACG